MISGFRRHTQMAQSYIKRILNAQVYDVARETPLDAAPLLSARLDNQAFLKREDLQPVFSFKCRGAYNKMVHLDEAARAEGVVAASAGNHAQGVALAASKLGIKATIVMPVTTPLIKVDAVKALGAKVVMHGDSFDEAAVRAGLTESEGFTFIHPFDDPDVIAEGTVAVELVRQAQQPLDYVFVCSAAAVAGGHGGLSAIRLATDADYRRGAGRRRLRSGRLGQRPSRHAARGGAVCRRLLWRRWARRPFV